ncbi:MAG: tRNA (adenosine(37)-N6)-threonylcarbamoyltransferase complex ATPase subunit type 1 TsaE [Bacteroidales bacterium]|nr:tRNA (adenosine(37)-N6)-threonylcarbamoyltransferase complex ATPase subunit type 1 TsaE [Bacteroidales bacterium]
MIVKKENIESTVRQILAKYPNQRIFVLDGEMGTGKTTFSTQFAKALGSLDHPSSPTFSIVNVYLRENGEEIYHFDFYRLEQFQEALDIGIEEYFESGNYCFIEWPDIVKRLLPDSYVNIKIENTDNLDERLLEITDY